jgi:outer membrane receptor protein involved in Fe transport
MHSHLRYSLLAAAPAALIGHAAPACAQLPDEAEFALPAQDLAASLRAVAAQTGRNVIAPASLVEGRRAPAISGRFTAEGAVRILLTGSELGVRRVGSTLVIVPPEGERDPPGGGGSDGPGEHAPEPAIVVTGTRIRGSGPVGTDLITIGRQDIDRSGHATAQDLLRTLPQNFGGGPGESTTGVSVRANATANTGYGSGINLRGLGASSTLVLLNGQRPPLGGFSGAFADLSLIPLSTIERIEVLPSGASALYGSDAVAGVVNIISRNRFEGVEASLRAGTADGDFSEVQASAVGGGAWATGRVVASVEHYRRGRLPAAGRPYASDDLTPFGGPDYRLPYAAPGTILAGGRSFAIPAGQNGVGLTPDRLRADEVNLGDSWSGTDLLPEQRRNSAFLHLEQQLGVRVRAYADALVAERHFDIRTRPISLAPRTVPVTNPFYVDPIGSGEPVRVLYDFRADLGPETMSGRVRAIAATAGAEASIGRWALDLHGSFGVQKEAMTLRNAVNSARLALALADTDPATAFNLFGSGGSNNPMTVAKVRGSSSSFYRYEVWSMGGKGDGPLFALPGGEVRLAAGGEYRQEGFRSRSIGDRSRLEPFTVETQFPGPRRVAAGFAELLVPLFGKANRRPGFERLDLSIAGRVEHYSDFGTTANPRAGLSWVPLEGAMLRASYGTSFRAPGFSDLQQGPESDFYFVFPLPDPAAPAGETNALVLRGNDPSMGPERAATWTAGIELEPRFVPGLHLEATWFHIRYRDRIADPSSELFNFLANREIYGALIDDTPDPATIAAFYADPSFVDLFGIPASAVGAIIDARNQNLSAVTESGIDFDLGYTRRLFGGRAEVGIGGTWLSKLDQAVTAQAPAADILDTLGNPADLRFRARALWTGGRLGVAAYLNHVAGYENRTVAVPERVSSWTTVDLQLSAMVGARDAKRLRLALNVSNLFDRDPPYVNNFNGLNAVGYDPENASPVGRMVSVQATMSW